MPNLETKHYELNEVSWWGKWVDETIWVSKNGYAIFSEGFKEETFYNRGGFLGVEKVPEDAIEALEREFKRRRRPAPVIYVEEGRPWDKMRASLASRGYVVSDRMLVMESGGLKEEKRRKRRRGGGGDEGGGSDSSAIGIEELGSGGTRGKGRDVLEWTKTYLEAFYGDQKLNRRVNLVMRKVIKDKKASVLLARIGGAAAGCGIMYRTAGGVAGAYCIGTAPPFRGRGVAAAMLRRIHELAEGEGRRLILQTMASDGVEDFYVKQGFRQAYIKSVFELRQRRAVENEQEEEEEEEEGRTGSTIIPSGETFGVWIDRGATAGATEPFTRVFSGFEKVEAIRRLFGNETEEVVSNLKVSLDWPRGYLRVDNDTGNIIMNPEYLRTGDEKHLYLDVIHELTHVKQFREGKELYDRRYAYFERPTEIEAYKMAVEEARRIGMDNKEIIEYLRVEWVTEEEFMRFVSKMRIEESPSD